MSKEQFIDLGKQPLANGFLTEDQFKDEYFYNLSYSFDTETKLIKQDTLVNPGSMFNDSYPYHTSGSETMTHHFKSIASQLTTTGKILEIGSNDGAFITNVRANEKVAIEPCGNFAKITNDAGIKTYTSFFNTQTAFEIYKNHGKFDTIYSANCFCHIPDIEEAFYSISTLLKDDGTFIIEDPSLIDMMLRTSYSQLYDEHVSLFSVIALEKLLAKYGLSIFKVEHLDVHGGSNRIYCIKTGLKPKNISDGELNSVNKFKSIELYYGLDKLDTYMLFGERVANSKKLLVDLLTEQKDQGKKIISYGATSKSTTTYNYCNIGPELIDYITDITPAKQGKFSPGKHIPVISPEEGLNDTIDTIYLSAWNFTKEIMNKEVKFKDKIWITNVPTVKIIKV